MRVSMLFLQYHCRKGGYEMKYCSHCGRAVADEAVVCPGCGCSVADSGAELDVPSTGMNVLAFLLPLVGLVLYCVYHDKTPVKSKQIGKWALIGFCVGVVLEIFLIAI